MEEFSLGDTLLSEIQPWQKGQRRRAGALWARARLLPNPAQWHLQIPPRHHSAFTFHEPLAGMTATLSSLSSP